MQWVEPSSLFHIICRCLSASSRAPWLEAFHAGCFTISAFCDDKQVYWDNHLDLEWGAFCGILIVPTLSHNISNVYIKYWYSNDLNITGHSYNLRTCNHVRAAW